MSRTKRSAWSLATSVTYSGVTVIIGFFATPLLLRCLGAERYGAFKAMAEWFAYLPLLELGLGGALAACLAPAIGKGDTAHVRAIVKAGLIAYCRITPVIAVTGVALSFLLPRFPGFRVLNARELSLAALIMMIAAIWNPCTVFRVLAESRQRSYFVNGLLLFQGVLSITLLVLTAQAGWGLPGQALATVAAQIPTVTVLAWMGLRAYPGVLRTPMNRRAGAELWKLNWPTFAHTLSNRLGLFSDNLIVALFLGPAAVGPFYLTQRIGYLVQTQLQAIGNASWAGLVELHARGQREIFRRRLLELTGLTSGLALAILLPVGVFNGFFTTQWVGAANYAGAAITWLAVFNMWLGSIFSLWGWPICGTGHIAMWLPYALLFTALNIGVSLAATWAAGLRGPLIGTAVSYLLVQTWALPLVLRRLFDVGVWQLWRTVLEHLLWAVPYGALLVAMTRSRPPHGWLELLPEMALGVAGGAACWWMFGLSRGARVEWVGRLRAAAGV